MVAHPPTPICSVPLPKPDFLVLYPRFAVFTDIPIICSVTPLKRRLPVLYLGRRFPRRTREKETRGTEQRNVVWGGLQNTPLAPSNQLVSETKNLGRVTEHLLLGVLYPSPNVDSCKLES